MSLPDQLRKELKEEGNEQKTDMHPVHVRIRRDHDLIVAQVLQIILDAQGRPRTSKAISPIQREGDHVAFGSRDAKLRGAMLQKQAWDRNALLLEPLFADVCLPRQEEARFQGEFGVADAASLDASSAESLVTAPAHIQKAETLQRRASCSLLYECASKALDSCAQK